MSEELLAEATRALREAPEASEIGARVTRARILNGLQQARVRRRTRFAFLLPIAATFVAASAFGAKSGTARVVWASIERLVHRSAAPHAGATSSARLPEGVRQVPFVPAAPLVPESTVVPESQTVNPPPAVAIASAFRATRVAPVTRHEVGDKALALYRVAHTAHFVDRDPARALVAWDAYLVAAPSGTFAPEAHYNRALSLVRLGRTSEARGELEPFARGAYAGYRQADAAALLQRLGP